MLLMLWWWTDCAVKCAVSSLSVAWGDRLLVCVQYMFVCTKLLVDVDVVVIVPFLLSCLR